MRKGIDVIQNAMLKLDSSQDIKTCPEHPFIKFFGVDFSAPFTSQDAMLRIESALELLSDVKDFMSSALSLIKQESKKHQGLRSFVLLPLDIIAIILSYLSAGAHSSTQGGSYYKCNPKEVVAFSQSCRQFREIALQIPSLWAGIKFGRRMEDNSRYLVRSRSAGLSITLPTHSAVSVEKCHSFIQTLLPHRQRWKSFHIVVSDNLTDCRELLRGIGRQCAHIHLPELRELVIEYDDQRLDEDDLMPNLDDSDSDFFSTWAVPQLRHLAVMNYLPRAVPFASSVTDLSIDVSRLGRQLNLPLHDFVQYLQFFPNVKTLKVNLLNAIISGSGRSPTCLSNLQNLALCVICEPPNLTGLQTLLASFEFPVVTCLKSNGYLRHCTQLGPWLQALLKGPKFPSLTDLKIDYSVYEIVDCGVDDALSLAPKLRHLDFKLEEDRSLHLNIHNAHRSRPPPLQTMRFNIPSAFEWDDVDFLVSSLARESDGLKRLSIVGRPVKATYLEGRSYCNILSFDT